MRSPNLTNSSLRNPDPMKSFCLSTVIGFFAAVNLTLAEEPDISKLPKPAEKTIDFVKDIKPIFEKSCFGCHGAKVRAKSKYFMNNRKTTIEGGSSKEAAIIVGKSEKSPLIHLSADLIEEMEMPPIDNREKYPKVTKKQIALIRAWIDQGAKWPEDIKLNLPPAK